MFQITIKDQRTQRFFEAVWAADRIAGFYSGHLILRNAALCINVRFKEAGVRRQTTGGTSTVDAMWMLT
jgi:hypothetical protein